MTALVYLKTLSRYFILSSELTPNPRCRCGDHLVHNSKIYILYVSRHALDQFGVVVLLLGHHFQVCVIAANVVHALRALKLNGDQLRGRHHASSLELHSLLSPSSTSTCGHGKTKDPSISLFTLS
jgi:hypothetical protein